MQLFIVLILMVCVDNILLSTYVSMHKDLAGGIIGLEILVEITLVFGGFSRIDII